MRYFAAGATRDPSVNTREFAAYNAHNSSVIYMAIPYTSNGLLSSIHAYADAIKTIIYESVCLILSASELMKSFKTV